jgi:uncharacterized protein
MGTDPPPATEVIIMSDVWDDRKKALEEEYFHRKEKEAIEKMRAQVAAEEAARLAEEAAIHCPKCDGKLVEISYEGVQIDRCEKCNGVWLDAGELEHLKKHEDAAGWLGRVWEKLSG